MSLVRNIHINRQERDCMKRDWVFFSLVGCSRNNNDQTSQDALGNVAFWFMPLKELALVADCGRSWHPELQQSLVFCSLLRCVNILCLFGLQLWLCWYCFGSEQECSFAEHTLLVHQLPSCSFSWKKFWCMTNYFPLEKQELEAPAQVETTCIPVPTGVRKVWTRECVMPLSTPARAKYSHTSRML